jgi:ABC-type uncharacterized transport system auxiliary subunit
MRSALLALALSMVSIGCISVGIGESSGQPQVQYRLEDLAQPPARAARQIPRSLVIVAMPSASVGDTFSMAYSRVPQQRSLYQYASWTDRPSNRIVQLLERRIDARGLFESVSELGHGLRGNVVLNVTVDELVHDTVAARGRLHLTVELIDRAERTLVARRRFTAEAPVAQENSRGAAEALSRAVTTALDDVMAWLEEAATRLPAKS